MLRIEITPETPDEYEEIILIYGNEEIMIGVNKNSEWIRPMLKKAFDLGFQDCKERVAKL